MIFEIKRRDDSNAVHVRERAMCLGLYLGGVCWVTLLIPQNGRDRKLSWEEGRWNMGEVE